VTDHPGSSTSAETEKSVVEEKSVWSGPAKIAEEKSRYAIVKCMLRSMIH
jgi:hypothetical protein